MPMGCAPAGTGMAVWAQCRQRLQLARARRLAGGRERGQKIQSRCVAGRRVGGQWERAACTCRTGCRLSGGWLGVFRGRALGRDGGTLPVSLDCYFGWLELLRRRHRGLRCTAVSSSPSLLCRYRRPAAPLHSCGAQAAPALSAPCPPARQPANLQLVPPGRPCVLLAALLTN